MQISARIPAFIELARKGRAARKQPSTPRTCGASSVALRGAHVLVIDDPEHARTLEHALTAEGCEVRTARTASDGLASLATFAAHAVIVEVVLPGMSGLLLTRVLQADPATRDLVVIAVSSVNGPAVERIAKEAGCSAYLRKPIAASVIVRTLAHYLKDRR